MAEEHDKYRQGAGWILLCDPWNVLVFRMKRNPPIWQLPQGGIEDGEDFIEGAFRELREETGIAPDLVFPIWVVGPYRYDIPEEIRNRHTHRYAEFVGQEQKWIIALYQGDPGQIRLEDSDGTFTDWEVVPLEDIGKRISDFKKGLYNELIAEAQKFQSLWISRDRIAFGN